MKNMIKFSPDVTVCIHPEAKGGEELLSVTG